LAAFGVIDEAAIRKRYWALPGGALDVRARRLPLGAEALAAGR
jgi:hypothetical protein